MALSGLQQVQSNRHYELSNRHSPNPVVSDEPQDSISLGRPSLQDLQEGASKLEASSGLVKRVLLSDMLTLGAKTAILASFAVGVLGTAAVASTLLGDGYSLLTAGLASAPFALGGFLIVPNKINDWMHANPDILSSRDRKEIQAQSQELLASGRQLCLNPTPGERSATSRKTC